MSLCFSWSGTWANTVTCSELQPRLGWGTCSCITGRTVHTSSQSRRLESKWPSVFPSRCLKSETASDDMTQASLFAPNQVARRHFPIICLATSQKSASSSLGGWMEAHSASSDQYARVTGICDALVFGLSCSSSPVLCLPSEQLVFGGFSGRLTAAGCSRRQCWGSDWRLHTAKPNCRGSW